VSAAAESQAVRRGVFERWLFWPSMALLALIAAELGTRGVYILRGAPYAGAAARETFTQITTLPEPAALSEPRNRRNLLLHPFLGYDSPQGLAVFDGDITAERAAGTEPAFDVLLLGGDTAMRLAPLLAEKLAQREGSGPRGRLWNFARPGWKQPQGVDALMYLAALGMKPDAVVCVDGWNEVDIGAANAARKSHPIQPSLELWGPLANGRVADRETLDDLVGAHLASRGVRSIAQRMLATGAWRSALCGKLALHRIAGLESERDARLAAWRKRQTSDQAELVLRGPHFEGDEPHALTVAATLWVRAARTLEDLCRGRGIALVHVLEPARPGKARVPTPATDRAARGYARLTAALRTLGSEGVEVRDGNALLGELPDDAYAQDGRLGESGLRRLAAVLAQALE
jgi:hypothetical protein